ncbi:CPBP family intramembrane metalloprotease [Synechococcus sp. CS-1325]|uniref:CPBP family intramembrane glutamic endopeptidase n=1 Tax=Synechococcus sp. CS-1325 TaxID=2847979 RepID=UPI000DB0F2C9|nr:CPBP family intramembrane glutamic endopeptidase [Synechococcus sp. CS-1325]MCT0199523.1 CPBP family intramembrane metalloprotease [Synechococcus sp. CS-1325]PZV02530.1 MAG: CPBP family intramembrane metalloprotease domain-containing protein [Cyanobium sp.]
MGGLRATIETVGERRLKPVVDRQRPGLWKVALALISLALSLLLWINGLLESLDRPSVGNDLVIRQLELAALAAPQVSPSLHDLLIGENPEAALLEEIERQSRPENDLLRALLQLNGPEPSRARPLLETLRDGGDPATAALAARLLAEPGSTDPGRPQPELPGSDPLLRRLSCLALGGSGSSCALPREERQAFFQLIGVTLLPSLAALGGVLLIGREIWLRWRGLVPEPPPLLGPPLGVIDVILLVAGGFVLLGEVATPLLITPLISGALHGLAIESPLADGLSVLLLYLGLMAAPLTILALMLGGQRPEGGWLQYRWRPVGSALRKGLKGLLIVLPLVSLASWLQQLVWSDPGGSNPLLELVLRSTSPLALFCFAFTAIVLAPLFEETIFRGVLLPVLVRQLGAGWGVVVSSAVFALAHLSLSELAPLFVLGLALGWLRLASGRLSASIWLHALWNGLTFSNLVLLGS